MSDEGMRAAIIDDLSEVFDDAILTSFVWGAAYKRPGDYDTVTYYALGNAPHMAAHETEGLAARLLRTLIADNDGLTEDE